MIDRCVYVQDGKIKLRDSNDDDDQNEHDDHAQDQGLQEQCTKKKIYCDGERNNQRHKMHPTFDIWRKELSDTLGTFLIART